jgi:DUF1009 family protein
MSNAPKLGLIAGGGQAPYRLIEFCRKMGRELFVVCLQGQAGADLANDVPHVWLPLGAGEKLKQVVQEQNIAELVMLGAVRRPSLTELKPDWLALKVVTKIGMGFLGDDALLTALGKAIESETGAKLVGVHEVYGDLLTPSGLMTEKAPDEQARQDILRGMEIAKELGRLDIGQSVVVQQGLVLGVEAIEGTDELIRRTGSLQREGLGGVLVKMAKPQQDRRFDLPSFGPNTVKALHEAGLRGLAVQAGHSLLIDREKTIALADELGLFMLGVEE